ncbi:MAG: HEAT repeat domain-containing protein [Planctomycetota bacterium]
MRRLAFLLPLLAPLFLLPVTAAEDGAEDPVTVLAEARKAHLDLVKGGLRSFSAEMTLRRSGDENLARSKELAGFGYSFTAPETEEFDFEKTHESLHKGLTEAVRNFWRDVTGAHWFGILESAADLRIEAEEPFTVVAGTAENLGEFRASFEGGTRKLVEIDFVKLQAKISFVYDTLEDGHRVSWREVSYKEKRVLRTTYHVFRTVSGFELPTVLKLESTKNTTEFAVKYVTVNGVPARMEELDEAVVKKTVAEFEKAWRGWEEGKKIAEMQDLSETSHDLVSAAIAKKGLRDRSPEVRAQSAEALGVMKRENVVPALIAAMKKNEKEIDVYLGLIQALGEIGDPRAVDILSKDWWNQRIGEYGVAAAKAKIRALGKIKHVTAVDALIDTFYVTKDEWVSYVKDELILSLRKLTRQDFRYDRKAWKAWWKKNRAKHEFE